MSQNRTPEGFAAEAASAPFGPAVKVKVAVVGSGLSGLATAHILSTQPSNRFSVTLYEKAQSIGMDSGSVDLKCLCKTCSGNLDSIYEHQEERKRVDVPMRGFYPSWYPSVVALYDYLGIPYAAVGSGSSFSVRVVDGKDKGDGGVETGKEGKDGTRTADTEETDDGATLLATTGSDKGSDADESEEAPDHASQGSGSSAPTAVSRSPTEVDDDENGDGEEEQLPPGVVKPIFVSGTFNIGPFELFFPTPLFGFDSKTTWTAMFSTILSWCKPSSLISGAKAAYSGVKVGYQWYRMMIAGRDLRATGQLAEVKGTIYEYLVREGFDEVFIERVFLPAMASVSTCTMEDVKKYPARNILDFFAPREPPTKGTILQYPIARPKSTNFHFVQCGIREVCNRLVKPVDRVLVNTGIRKITRTRSGKWKVETEMGEVDEYEFVVFATQAHQIAWILGDGGEAAIRDPEFARHLESVKRLFGRVEYVRSMVAVHSDPALLPPDRTTWRAMNFVLHQQEPVVKTVVINRTTKAGPVAISPAINPTASITGSHYLNHTFPSLGAVPYFQTWNPWPLPRPSLTSSLTYFDRALVTEDSVDAMDQVDLHQGRYGLAFAGSFVWPGIPLLEGCVKSAARCCGEVGRMFGVEVVVPWMNGGVPGRSGVGERLSDRFFRGEV